MTLASKAANGSGSMVFIDDVTADRSSRIISEVCWNLLSAQIKPNAAKLIGQTFTVQMDNDSKHTTKATQSQCKVKIFNGQVSHLT